MRRFWISARSIYRTVQHSRFGAIGQKIDGALHDGGNDRNGAPNDFTQVIPDGIGAWITNNGRAEMVSSVYPYYSI